MNILTVIALLKWALVAQSSLGFVLCAFGIRTCAKDLSVVLMHKENGGRRMAQVMRFKQETCLLISFAMLIIVGVYFMTPADEILRVNHWRVIGARTFFNVQVLTILMVKIIGHRGRRRIDAYYDEHSFTENRTGGGQ